MTPVERLALSRERLRAAMLPPPAKPESHSLSDGMGGFFTDLMEHFRSMPDLARLIGRIEGWWARHPLRSAAVLVAEASRMLATPTAKRHPLALVLGAALAGALFAISRPWRWIVSPALFAGLLPSLASRAIRELPVASWLKALTSIGPPHVEPGASVLDAPGPGHPSR